MPDLTAIKILATLQGTLTNSIDGGSYTASVVQGFSKGPTTQLTNGTSANQANRIWQDTGRFLASSGTEDLDLYDLGSIDIGAGAGKDALGQTFTLAEVVALCVYLHPTSAGNLLVGGKGTSAAWTSPFSANTDKLTIKPGGMFFLYAPTDPAYAVVDSTNHLLKLEASGGACTYDVAVLGRSA